MSAGIWNIYYVPYYVQVRAQVENESEALIDMICVVSQDLSIACTGVRGERFAAYATYDLSNLATLKVWSLKVTMRDIAWGMILTTLSAAAGYWALHR